MTRRERRAAAKAAGLPWGKASGSMRESMAERNERLAQEHAERAAREANMTDEERARRDEDHKRALRTIIALASGAALSD